MPFRQARPSKILITYYSLPLIFIHFQQEFITRIATLLLHCGQSLNHNARDSRAGSEVAQSTLDNFPLTSGGSSRHSRGAQTDYPPPVLGSLARPSSGLLARGLG
jgi:hypothetical protein